MRRFVDNFNGIELLDEKAHVVNQFLQKSLDVLIHDPFWKTSTQDERTEASVMMEKVFMCRIYQSAFFPNGELDREKDTLFESHITEISKFITMDHEAIQINQKYRSQAPWTPAQRDLQKINVYKAPGDKLMCIVQACKTIMSACPPFPLFFSFFFFFCSFNFFFEVFFHLISVLLRRLSGRLNHVQRQGSGCRRLLPGSGVCDPAVKPEIFAFHGSVHQVLLRVQGDRRIQLLVVAVPCRRRVHQNLESPVVIRNEDFVPQRKGNKAILPSFLSLKFLLEEWPPSPPSLSLFRSQSSLKLSTRCERRTGSAS